MSFVGLAIAATGGYGLLSTLSFAENFSAASIGQGFAFDKVDWSGHWRLWSLVIAFVGVATTVAGVVIARKIRWGLLVVAGTSVFAAVFPWIVARLESVQYAFERESVCESAFYSAIGVVALFIFYADTHSRVEIPTL